MFCRSLFVLSTKSWWRYKSLNETMFEDRFTPLYLYSLVVNVTKNDVISVFSNVMAPRMYNINCASARHIEAFADADGGDSGKSLLCSASVVFCLFTRRSFPFLFSCNFLLRPLFSIFLVQEETKTYFPHRRAIQNWRNFP
jgi:hypothetical protein